MGNMLLSRGLLKECSSLLLKGGSEYGMMRGDYEPTRNEVLLRRNGAPRTKEHISGTNEKGQISKAGDCSLIEQETEGLEDPPKSRSFRLSLWRQLKARGSESEQGEVVLEED